MRTWMRMWPATSGSHRTNRTTPSPAPYAIGDDVGKLWTPCTVGDRVWPIRITPFAIRTLGCTPSLRGVVVVGTKSNLQ